MAAFDTTRNSYGTVGVKARFDSVVSSVLASITAWNDARVTRNALSKLTDRELSDIGLNRGDISQIASSQSRI